MNEYIDREELKKAVDTWDRFYYVPLQGVKRGCNDDYTALVRIDDILHCIDNMPVADVQPIKHSHWFYPFSELDVNRCWECGFHVQDKINNVREMFKYCPHCGARMDGEQK